MNMPFLFNPVSSRSLACTLAAAALLAGCGGGDDAAPADTLSGVAAVGAPIVNGNVAVKCAGGSPLATTTNATGNWLVTISGQTLPCAVQVSGGTIGGAANTMPYHSMATGFGTVNITPLTDLMVAGVVNANLQSWFASPVFTGLNATALNNALTSLTNGLGISAPLNALNNPVNPITAAFAAKAGDPVDDWLEAFKAAIATIGQNYGAVLQAVQTGNYGGLAALAGAFSNALAPVAPPVSPPVTLPVTPPVLPPNAGDKTLTVAVSVSGVPTTAINVGVVPAPANQAEFCNDLQNDATFSSLGQQGASLKINSCSFSGNVGQVSATLSASGLSFPYSITYTYN
jgi:hypothetical protein